MINWSTVHFKELKLVDFHDLLALRVKVFVVEQDCPYQELDGKDKKCYHVMGRDGQGNIIATARIVPPHVSYEQISIGRVVVDDTMRKTGVGHELMIKCLEFIHEEFGPTEIKISAQKYLLDFYQSHGFTSTDKEYLEDGIPHVEMISNKIKQL